MSTSQKTMSILWHSELDKGIFVALVMGEGSITITSQGKRGFFTPRITINNTEKEIIDLATKILRSIGIKYRFRTIFSPTQIGSKNLYRIDIKGIKTVLPLLLSTKDLYVGRKAKLSELVIEFSTSRLSHKKKPYSFREREIISQIRTLNPRGKNFKKEGCQ